MTDAALPRDGQGRATGAPWPSRSRWAWLGLVPFFALRLRVPDRPDVRTWSSAASRTEPGNSTLQNYADLATPDDRRRVRTSIEISLVTAIVGGIFGFLLAYAVILGRPAAASCASALMTFSGVASNFAGVPLALAFIFTLGRLGLVTRLPAGASGSTSTAAASRSTRSSGSRSSTSTSSSRSWS